MSKEKEAKKKQQDSPYAVYGLHILVHVQKETPKDMELHCPKGDNVVYGQVLTAGDGFESGERFGLLASRPRHLFRALGRFGVKRGIDGVQGERGVLAFGVQADEGKALALRGEIFEIGSGAEDQIVKRRRRRRKAGAAGLLAGTYPPSWACRALWVLSLIPWASSKWVWELPPRLFRNVIFSGVSAPKR